MLQKVIQRNKKKIFNNEILKVNKETYEKSFYRAIKPAIKVAKCFGLFPIDISSTQPNDVKFQWISIKSLISYFFIACIIYTSILALKTQFESGPFTPANIVSILYFSACASISIMFFRVALKWKTFMVKWSEIEIDFLYPKYERPSTEWSLRKKILIFLSIAFFMAIFEHFLSIGDHIYRFTFEANYCNFTIEDPFEYFVVTYQGFIIRNLPFAYNNFVGALVLYLNYSYTFWWNFLDIFSILISIGLSDLFERLNHRMESIKMLQIDEITWSELRYTHVRLCELINVVNELLGVQILVSCGNNGYFILIQMLNVTHSLPFAISKLYFWCSLLFLIARATAAILYGARVYESARGPLEVIRSVPSEYWCEELQRFFDQLKNDSNALNGKNFFFIRRSLLFSIAGALITYELVLLQFDESGTTWEDVVDCNLVS